MYGFINLFLVKGVKTNNRNLSLLVKMVIRKGGLNFFSVYIMLY